MLAICEIGAITTGDKGVIVAGRWNQIIGDHHLRLDFAENATGTATAIAFTAPPGVIHIVVPA